MKALVVTIESHWPLSRHWHIIDPLPQVADSVRSEYGKVARIEEYVWSADAPNCADCGEKLA